MELNPFSVRPNKKPKFTVVNRRVKGGTRKVRDRDSERSPLSKEYAARNKSGAFVDRRFGEGKAGVSRDEVMMQRFAKERVKRSKKDRYNLSTRPSEDITHKGKVVGEDYKDDGELFQDSDDEGTGLDKADTEMHFGGGRNGQKEDPYGMYGGGGRTLKDIYGSNERRDGLDDVIKMSKIRKMERQREKEEQVEVFEGVDEAFGDLRGLLGFRDKGADRDKERERKKRVREGEEEPEEDDDYEQMARMFAFEKKGAATDRTKTQEEVALEREEKLREMEERRIKRMNGDFSDDDMSDVAAGGDDLGEEEGKKGGVEMRFTADGIKYVDEEGREVEANYRVKEQFQNKSAWYEGVVAKVNKDGTYDVQYDDGDFEEGVEEVSIKVLGGAKKMKKEKKEKKKKEEEEAEGEEEEEEEEEKEEEEEDGGGKERRVKRMKEQEARRKAMSDMPYTFSPPPTTTEALEDLIAEHCGDGKDVNELVKRIHESNSVLVNKERRTVMQNFFDVLVRRYVALGDRVVQAGGGGG
ncbi:hypothetical protein TrRE_jg8544, partial [Triparma retinervis]